MNIGQFLIEAVGVIRSLQKTESAYEIMILRDCMAKSMHMGVGDLFRNN